MSGFDVPPWQLEGTAGRLDAIADELEVLLARLGSAASATFEGWRGDVAALAGRRWEQWDAGARDVIGGLRAMAAALANTAREYAGAEQASAVA